MSTTDQTLTRQGASDAPMPAAPQGMTPAGLQLSKTLTRRRWISAIANIATYLAMMGWLASILAHDGWSIVDAGLLVSFALAAPWGVLNIWNGAFGLWAKHFSREGLKGAAPYMAAGDMETPVTAKTAVLMTICNEDPQRALSRFAIVRDSVERTGEGGTFSWFILSDTRDAAIAEEEERAFAAWKAAAGAGGERLFYRRRSSNEGYKAGNVREFCETHGANFEFMINLDADSLMTGETIVRMVRIGQAWPKIGILQSLMCGAPTSSAFARMFQFGMRNGMRPYTVGSAWWNGDCGPYWGHNALVRIAPFREHCHLPELPGKPPFGGRILSHDQVEAVMMRRAGFEVRVTPLESGSYEDNPPTLTEFARRDSRWCQGNLQYFKLLAILKGIEPASRFQLVWAILMFASLPAMTVMIALAALKPLDGENLSLFPATSALWFYIVFFFLFLSPKIFGFVDVALTKGGVASYGGVWKFLAGCVSETMFAMLLLPITTFHTSVFIFGLAFGKSVSWGGQSRDPRAVSFTEALAHFWPQTVFGLILLALAAVFAPAMIIPGLAIAAGYLLAVPFAMLTASKALGGWMEKTRLCGIPEEFKTPPEIAAITNTKV